MRASAGMQGLEWLEGIFGSVRCASCGNVYRRDDVSVVGNRDDYWFLRCNCAACGTQGIGVVIVKEIARVDPGVAHESDGPALLVDDVLAAHEVLVRYEGNAEGLFQRV